MRIRKPSDTQLCAIAGRLFAPQLEAVEWKERIKRALVAQRLAYPSPHVLAQALDRVEYARKRRGSLHMPRTGRV